MVTRQHGRGEGLRANGIHGRRRPGRLGRLRTTCGGIPAALLLLAAGPPLESPNLVDRQVVTAQARDVAASEPSSTPTTGEPATRVASRTPVVPGRGSNELIDARTKPAPAVSEGDPIAMAKKAIADCQARFRSVQDYSCTFIKRERVDGQMTQPHIMAMKSRTNPNSFYFKFQQPNKGREAIYVHGRNNGLVIAHDIGLGKLLAGTMRLDPRGARAMEENRHPITEAGIGSLIDTVARHWAVELTPGESQVTIHPEGRVGGRPCTVVESVHPRPGANLLFHRVMLYIDRELGVPIRFEAYDWPRQPGSAAELVEEYTYHDLKLNVGLHDRDFDPANAQYSYGRL
jgi:outer membrane lipoprotein-sorting protein